MKAYQITLNGKVFEVQVEELAPGTVVQPSAPVAAPAPAPVAQAPSGGGQSVTAPMPGTIVNILVKQGQAVKKGDVVAILEAMKMENEIQAPVDGTVGSISADKGQNVDLGAAILEIV